MRCFYDADEEIDLWMTPSCGSPVRVPVARFRIASTPGLVSSSTAVSRASQRGRFPYRLHTFCIAPAHTYVAVGDKGSRPAGGNLLAWFGCGMLMRSF